LDPRDARDSLCDLGVGGPGDGGPNVIRPDPTHRESVVRQDVVVEKMTQNPQFAILFPLVVGVGAVVCTIFVHALAIVATVNLFRYERRRGRAGAGALIDLAILMLVISFAFVAHLIEIALWATLLVLCGEFQEFGIGFYCSAVNYTTLGYGDVLLTSSWRLLGPLEATNGALMFGVSAAMVFAVIQRLVLARYKDLRY
jgi:CDP-diglyceride synthetase